MMVGLIGLGKWGRNLLRVFDGRSDVIICANQSSKSAQSWVAAHYPDVRSSFDSNEVIEHPEVEIVVVASPIDTHYEYSKRSLLASKHVFEEKPMTTNSDQAQELIQLAQGAGKILFVGHIFLYHPVMSQLLSLMSDDPPDYITGSWNKMGSFSEDIQWNLVSHDVSIALALFDEIPVSAARIYSRGLVSIEDNVGVRLVFSGGRECILMANRCSPLASKSITVQTRSGLLYHWIDNRLYVQRAGQPADLVFESAAEPLALEVEDFLQKTLERPSIPFATQIAVQVVDVVEQIAGW